MDLYYIFLLLLMAQLPLSFSTQNKKYDTCSQKLECGNMSNLSYPFYDGSTRPDYCGYPGFKLDCTQSTPWITVSDQTYNLLGVKTDTITISRTDKWVGGCPDNLINSTFDNSNIFNLSSSSQNITFLFNCDTARIPSTFPTIRCNLYGEGLEDGYYLTQQSMIRNQDQLNVYTMCETNLYFPILVSEAEKIDQNSSSSTLIRAFESGFELSFEVNVNDGCNLCSNSGGECGYDWVSDKFVCHCSDNEYDAVCKFNRTPEHNSSAISPGPNHNSSTITPDPNRNTTTNIPTPRTGHHKNMIPITASSAATGIVILGFLAYFSFYILQKCKPIPQNQSVEDCLKNYASLVPRRYTYANIKKMTKSFKEKLGEGGYGAVFKGKLQDGCVVAVKVWKQSKGDGQEFVNEVMSISRTSHVNIVPLLGFCFEGYKRALVYEFMPNGSLEKFINGRDLKENNQSLSIQQLLDIAVGIARGLEYLHRGCNIRIVHFDIKPHNILLDSEFTPKISDFGLAKPFKQKESIISMSEARGTIGYIAPEVFFRSFGGVSHKSDVYSYGMMVLEMVGCIKRVDENSSELDFPQWIYKQLEEELALDGGSILNNHEVNASKRKLILVGLWCIQTHPSNRPPMSRVVEMLEGKIELLQVPPMPSLYDDNNQQISFRHK